MQTQQLRRYLVCSAVALLLVRLLASGWRSGFPSPFPDSSSYVAVARSNPWSLDFWFGQRPPTYPMLIWLTGSSTHALIVVQTFVAVLAVGWLCSTVWSEIRSRPVAIVSILLLLAIALQTRWVLWHTAMLTESLSASLAVAGVTAWWRWFREPDTFRLAVAVILTVTWMLLRDSNAMSTYAFALVAVVVVFAMDRRSTSERRRGMAVALAVLVVAGTYSLTAQLVSNRGETSFHNNVGLRWLPDPEMSSFMAGRGMPLSAALTARSGADAWADGEAFLRSPDLAGYRDWAADNGRIAAGASFVIKSDWYIARLLDELPAYTATDHPSYDEFDTASGFPERPLGVLDPVGSPMAMVLWMLMATAAVIVVWWRSRATAWFLAMLLVPVVIDLYLVYVADAIEVGRHLVGPMQRFSVVVVIAVAVAADAVISAPVADESKSDPATDPVEDSATTPIDEDV